MKLLSLAAGAAIAVGVSSLQSSAYSQIDGRSIPGVACHPLPSAGVFGTWFGTIVNSSETDPLRVMCPLTTPDKLTLGPEWSLHVALVQVFDRHTTQNVHCTRFSEYVSGSSYLLEDHPKHTTGASASVQSLSFGAEDPIYDHHYVTCSVPPKQNGNVSHLVSVRYVYSGDSGVLREVRSRSEAQRQEYANARVRLLQREHANEPQDAEWSQAAESKIGAVYSEPEFRALRVSAACKYTLCRLDIEYADARQGPWALQRFIETRPWSGPRFTHLDLERGEGSAYLVREGFSLPTLDPSGREHRSPFAANDNM